MEIKKVQSFGSPFGGNVIAMKDVKDKTTRKGSLRPLFDCVEAINAAVDALQTFVETTPQDKDASMTAKMLETLTSMQIKLLEMSKERIQQQNAMQPVGAGQDVEAPAQAETMVGNEGLSPEMMAAAKTQSSKRNG